MRTAAALVLLITISGAAFAADEGETIVQAKDTVEAVEKAHKKRDLEALQTAFNRLIELHNGMEGAAWRKKLQTATGRVLKDKKCPELHEAALETLEALDDGDGVFKQLKSTLPDAKATEVSDFEVLAVTAVGTVKAGAGVKYLADLAMNGQHMKTRIAAIEALSSYREVKKANVKALDGLFKVLVKAQPGDEYDGAVVNAWVEIEEPLLKALDDLSFLELDDTDAWTAWYAKNKSKLKKVFADVEYDDE